MSTNVQSNGTEQIETLQLITWLLAVQDMKNPLLSVCKTLITDHVWFLGSWEELIWEQSINNLAQPPPDGSSSNTKQENTTNASCWFTCRQTADAKTRSDDESSSRLSNSRRDTLNYSRHSGAAATSAAEQKSIWLERWARCGTAHLPAPPERISRPSSRSNIRLLSPDETDDNPGEQWRTRGGDRQGRRAEEHRHLPQLNRVFPVRLRQLRTCSGGSAWWSETVKLADACGKAADRSPIRRVQPLAGQRVREGRGANPPPVLRRSSQVDTGRLTQARNGLTYLVQMGISTEK